MMLITPSLLNGFQFYSHYFGVEEEDDTINREQFLRMLRRQPIENPSEAILRGRQLEADVQEYCESGGYDSAPKTIKEIGSHYMGGMWQVPLQRVMGEYLLYGRADFMRMDTIRDIKFTRTYEVGKFLKSAQHRIYLYATGLPRFIYDVTDGFSVWQEQYNHHDDLGSEINHMIRVFIGYLDIDAEAKELFYKHWQALK